MKTGTHSPRELRKQARNWPTCSPAPSNSGTATKTTAVQTNGRPRGEKCRDRTDDLQIWKAPHAQYTSIGAHLPPCLRHGPKLAPENDYVSMYLSAPKMEQTHCGRRIDIKQRQGILAETYIYREDGRSIQILLYPQDNLSPVLCHAPVNRA